MADKFIIEIKNRFQEFRELENNNENIGEDVTRIWDNIKDIYTKTTEQEYNRETQQPPGEMYPRETRTELKEYEGTGEDNTLNKKPGVGKCMCVCVCVCVHVCAHEGA